MRTRSLLAVAAFCAALALPGMAAAQEIAYASPDGYSNLRSGPSTRYPVIARVYPGSQVEVLGCLETRAWCDVVVEDIRGWIYANRLEFVYGGRRVLVPQYYSYFGAPYVFFNFGDDNRRRHRYRDRDRDRDRDNWKEGFHPPGGGDPGPVRIRPPRTENVPPDGDYLGHPGGGGPGPEYIRPGGGGTIEVPADGGGGPAGGGCVPGQQECVEIIR